NTVVAKPASSTPLSTIRLVELMNEGGLPPGVLNVVVGPGAVVGQELIKNPKVRKIGFTGETQTGKQVMAEAASDLKHVTLELGGSDPAIVCDDADLEQASKAIAIGRFFNAGQACLAVKRVYAFESIADELMEKLTARAKKLKVGPGSDAASQMGPMHTAGGRETIEAQLKDAVDRGARVLAGGKRLRGEPFDSGFFFEPTIITDVPLEARVWREETFGPLLPIARVKNLEEALERANDSEFGLGSSIFTRDLKKAQGGIDRHDAAVGAVIIAASGDAFSAGADLNEFLAERPSLGQALERRRLGALFLLIEAYPKALVAAVNGDALGAGFGLVAACHLAVAA